MPDTVKRFCSYSTVVLPEEALMRFDVKHQTYIGRHSSPATDRNAIPARSIFRLVCRNIAQQPIPVTTDAQIPSPFAAA